MKVYTDALFSNFDSTLSSCFPVCKKVMGAHAWRRLARSFFAMHRCTSPLFRQIPEEFLRYLEAERAAGSDLPPFIYSLAHYEWIELALSVAEVSSAPDQHDVQGDLMQGVPVLSPVLALLSYPYPVHLISPSRNWRWPNRCICWCFAILMTKCGSSNSTPSAPA